MERGVYKCLKKRWFFIKIDQHFLWSRSNHYNTHKTSRWLIDKLMDVQREKISETKSNFFFVRKNKLPNPTQWRFLQFKTRSCSEEEDEMSLSSKGNEET